MTYTGGLLYINIPSYSHHRPTSSLRYRSKRKKKKCFCQLLQLVGSPGKNEYEIRQIVTGFHGKCSDNYGSGTPPSCSKSWKYEDEFFFQIFVTHTKAKTEESLGVGTHIASRGIVPSIYSILLYIVRAQWLKVI
jgi:hypothetical protein